MRNRRSLTCALGLCVPLLVAGARVQAATIDYRVTGVVFSGDDQSGVFVAPGDSIVGKDFTAEYIFDDEKGSRFKVAPSYDDLYSSAGKSDPLLSASLTINGHSFFFNGLQSSNLYVNSLGHETGAAAFDAATSSQVYNYSFLATNNSVPTAPSSLDEPFNGPATGLSDFPADDFQIAYMDAVTGETVTSTGTLDVEFVSSTVSDAPEPAVWASMMAGVALMGAMLARRRRPLRIEAA